MTISLRTAGAIHDDARAQDAQWDVTWSRLLPSHRRPVLAKTPLLVALGAYLSGARLERPAVLATMVLATGLWAALYMLNEATDLSLESGVPVQRRRYHLIAAAVLAVCVSAAVLRASLGLVFAAMTVSEIAYSVPPLRVKRWWWAVVSLSGLINPLLRLECGALWGPHLLPISAWMPIVALHLGSSIRARTLLRSRDLKLGYAPAPSALVASGAVCTAVGLLLAFRLCASGALPGAFLFLIALAAVFAAYAWSGRTDSMATLRRGWYWFALLAALAVAGLSTAR